MPKNKFFSSRPKTKPSGTQFSWHPTTYEAAAEIVRQFNCREPLPGLMPQQVEIFYQSIARAATMIGGLECPARSDDPNSQYQVALHGVHLVMQRRENTPTAPWGIDEKWLNANPEMQSKLCEM